jgi:predicted small lipoprotein YifL
MSKTLFVGALAACLCGCGFRGPLYLPPAKAAQAKPPPAQPETTVTDPTRPVPADAAPPPK